MLPQAPFPTFRLMLQVYRRLSMMMHVWAALNTRLRETCLHGKGPKEADAVLPPQNIKAAHRSWLSKSQNTGHEARSSLLTTPFLRP